jgi:hypothetical protein
MCERGLVEPVLETGGSDPCVLAGDEGAVVEFGMLGEAD